MPISINKRKNSKHNSVQPCWPEPVLAFVEDEQDEDYEILELPLLHAASCDLMRQLMAQNPEGYLLTLYEQNHVEVDPWISVPLYAPDRQHVEILMEALGEMIRRHPEASLKELFDGMIGALEARLCTIRLN
jgi:hypothetical protein